MKLFLFTIKSILFIGLISIFSDSNAQICLNPLSSSSGKASAQDIVSFDLDKDGKPDIITANGTNNNFSVFYGDGKTPFGQIVSYDGVGTNAVAVSCVDLNMDSFLDIIVANKATGNISVYYNNGSRGFTFNKSYTIDGLLTDVVGADLNNDGYGDIAVTSRNKNFPLYVLINNTKGNFILDPYGDPKMLPSQLTKSDFNKDGSIDLAVSNDLGLEVFINAGDGSFKNSNTLTVTGPGFGIISGDLNADGFQDLVMSNNTSDYVSVMLGDNSGNGTFVKSVIYSAGKFPYGVEIADFNNDLKLDIAATSTDGFSILFGLGNGTFESPALFSVATTPKAIAIGDFMTDGKIDAVVTSPTNPSDVITLNNIGAAPTIPFTASKTSVCNGGSVVLRATSKTPIWDNGVINGTAFTPTTTKTYTVTDNTISAGCFSKASVTIAVLPNPTISATGANYCSGNSAVTLVASGTSVSYAWLPITGLSNAAIANPTTTPTASTTYTVTGTGSNGCTSSTTATVNYLLKPTITTTNGSFCEGNAGGVQITASGAGTTGTYSWTPALTLSNSAISNPIATPTSTTTYTVTGTSTNGCSNTATSNVIVYLKPSLTVTGGQMCFNGTGVGLTSTIASGATYSWTPTLGLSNSTISNPIATPSITTNYVLTITDAKGCTNTAIANVKVNALPTITTADASYCAGNTGVIITASGAGTGGSYTWTPTTNLSDSKAYNPLANPATTTTYTVKGIDANGCTNSNVVTSKVTVNAKPVISTTSGAFCLGSTGVQITATGALNYTWSPTSNLSSSNISNPIATPSTSTTYAVTGTDINGCTNSSTANVTVNALPIISATGGTICASGSGVNLIATGPSVYFWNWDNAATLDNSTIANPKANPTSTTTYTVTGKDINNCIASTTAKVTVNPLPTATISGAATICQNTSSNITFNFTGTGPWTFTYLAGSTPTTLTSSVNTYSLSVTPSITTTYTLQSVSDANCTATISSAITINVIPIPTAVISGSDTVCNGSSMTISVNLTGSKPWNIDIHDGTNTNYITNINSSPYTFVITPTNQAVYNITKITGNGCTGTHSGNATVGVYPITTVTISGSSTICTGNNGSFQVNISPTKTKPWTITYSEGGVNQTISNVKTSPLVVPITNPSLGLHTYNLISVKDSNMCVVSGLGTATIDVVAKPTAVLSTTGNACQGSSVSMKVDLTGVKPWSISYSDGINPANTITNIPSSPYNFTLIPTSAVTYQLTSVSDINCTGTTSGSVTINTAPALSFSGNKAICKGNSSGIDLNIIDSNSPWNIIYKDGTSNVNFTAASAITSINVSPIINTNYTPVSITNAKGCNGTISGSTTIKVNNLPTATISGTTSICPTKNTDISFNFTGLAPYNLTINNGSTNQVITTNTNPHLISVNPTATTTYSLVNLTDNNGCSNTITGNAIVTVLSPTDPLCMCPASAILSGAGTICENTSKNLTIALAGTSPWTVIYSDGSTQKTINTNLPSTSLTVNPTNTTNYTLVSVKDATCFGSASGAANVIVNKNPTALISGSQSICNGNNASIKVDLTGTTPYTVVYSDGTVQTTVPNISTPSYSFNVSPLNPTTYSLNSVSGNNGCVGTVNPSTAIVSLNPLPTAIFGSDQTICEKDSAILTVNLTGTKPWTVTYNDGGSNQTISGIQTSVYTFKLAPLSSKALQLTSVNDINCSNSASDIININVNSLPKVVANTTGTSVCSNQKVTLTGTGANTYSWTNSVIDGVAFSAITNKYFVTGQDLNGCSAKDSVSITVNSSPTLSITAIPNVICFGDSILLNAVGNAMSYTWSNGTINNSKIAPTSTQKYIVTANNSLCLAKDSVTVIVAPAPTAKAIASKLNVCNGNKVTLTSVVSASSFSWSNGVVDGVPFPITSTQKYMLTATTGSCSTKDSVTINVNQLPAVSITASAISVCSDEKITLTHNVTSDAYVWSDNVKEGIPFTPATQKYFITVDNGNCQAKDSVSITSILKPTVSINTSANTICEGETTTINATGASTYIWDNSLPAVANQTINPKTNTTYQVIGKMSGCTDTASINISVNPKPILTTTILKPTICEGESTTLNATGTNNYLWDNGLGTNPTNIINPITNTTYSVIGTDLNNCKDTASIAIVVNKIPVLSLSNTSYSLCGGSSTNLTLSSDIPSIFHWTSVVNNVTGANSSTSPSASTNYSIVNTLVNTSKSSTVNYSITAEANGCTSAAQSIIVNVDSCQAKADFKVDKTIICSTDSSVTYTDNSIGANSWTWDFGTDATPSTAVGKGPHIVKYNANGVKSTSLAITGLGVNDNFTASLVTLNSIQKPVATIGNSIFNQDSIETKIITTSIINADQYHWSISPVIAGTISDQTANPSLIFTTNYSGKIKAIVYASNIDGCNSVNSDTLLFTRQGSINIQSTKLKSYHNDSIPVNLTFTGTSPFTFSYQIGTEIKTITGINSNPYNFKIGQTGTISNVTAFDKDGISMIRKGSLFTVSLDTLSQLNTTQQTPKCDGEKGWLFTKISGGKAPFTISIAGTNYTVEANDSINILPGTYQLSITDATGYISKTIYTETLNQSTININAYKPILSSTDTDITLSATTIKNPTVTRNDIITTFGTMEYTWTYRSTNNGIDSIGKTANESSKIVYLKPRFSGTVYVAVQGNIGTCLTAVSDEIKIVVKPFVKNNSTADTIKFDLYGTAPFRINMKLNDVLIDTTINSNVFEISKTDINSLIINSISDLEGNASALPEPFIKQTENTVFEFYDGISPNGDLINDNFTIKNYVSKDGILAIYDLNGFEIIQLKNYMNDWSGRDLKGNMLREGLYLFKFECQGKKYTGQFELRK